MKYILLLTPLLLTPYLASAQTLQEYIPAIVNIIAGPFVVFLIGISFLVFVINVVRYFVVEAANEEAQEKAKMVALYSVLGFVLVIVFSGIVNLIASNLNLHGQPPVTSDYVNPR